MAQPESTPTAAAERKRERSVALAERAGLLGAATFCEERNAYRLYEVPSEDRSQVYSVAYDALECSTRCSCAAGQRGHACKHAGSVEHAETQRARAMASASDDEAWRYWANGGEW